jgi:hypothetical protein
VMAGVIVLCSVLVVSIAGVFTWRYCANKADEQKVHDEADAEDPELQARELDEVPGVLTLTPVSSTHSHVPGHGRLQVAAVHFNGQDIYSQLSISTASPVDAEPEDAFIALTPSSP